MGKRPAAGTPAMVALERAGVAFTSHTYEYVVAVVPVSSQLDLKALAAAIGAKKAVMADPAVAARVTGYVVGGISPIGQKRRLRTVLDSSALEHDKVYVSGGRRGFDLGLAPADLVAVTGATTAAVSRSRA